MDKVSEQSYTQYEHTVSNAKKYNSKAFYANDFDNRKQVTAKKNELKYIDFRRRYYIPETKKNNAYQLGEIMHDKRVIDVDSISNPKNSNSSAPKGYNCSPYLIAEYNLNTLSQNGYIDKFRQGQRGDCYLLAALESLAGTEEGKKILKNNITKNDDGSYTVTFPGAIAAKNHYTKTGEEDKCAITGTYVISPAAINKAVSLAGKSYAYGDIDVIIYELAMEAYRAEVLKTNKALGQEDSNKIAGKIEPPSEIDTLSSGYLYDAVYILSGNKSDYYHIPDSKKENIKLYKPGEYGYITENQTPGIILYSNTHSEGISEIKNYYDKESDLQKMLDKCKGHEKDYSITVGVICAEDGPDGTTKAGGGHGLAVTKITDEYVEVVNPWDTSKKERIPRYDFEKMVNHLNVARISQQEEELAQNTQDIKQKMLNQFKKLPKPSKVLEEYVKFVCPGLRWSMAIGDLIA